MTTIVPARRNRVLAAAGPVLEALSRDMAPIGSVPAKNAVKEKMAVVIDIAAPGPNEPAPHVSSTAALACCQLGLATLAAAL